MTTPTVIVSPVIAPGGGGVGNVGSVIHGSDANLARPTIFTGIIIWIGTVQPVNMIAGDVWFNPNANP